MKRFILRRLGYSLVSLVLLSIIIFFFVRVTGDPAVLLVEPGASQADLEAVRHQFGLDRSAADPVLGLHDASRCAGTSASRSTTARPCSSCISRGCRIP